MKVRSATRLGLFALLLASSACSSRRPLGADAAGGGPQDTGVEATPGGPDARDTGGTDAGGPGGAPGADANRDAVLDSVIDSVSDAGTDVTAEIDAPADDGPAPDASVPDGSVDRTGGDVPCGSPTDPKNCGTCRHDCTALQRVRADKVECRDGACVIPAGACLPGYANCSGDPERGCESDVTQSSRCGCGVSCATGARLCASPADGPPMCVASCAATGLTACGQQCVDLQTNVTHCSGCNATCRINNAEAVCVAGQCAVSRCLAGYGDCDPGLEGCETNLGTFYDCGSCRDSCAAAHAEGTCRAAACTRTCHAGFGNCDTTNPDCETPLDTAASCGACGAACPVDRPLCGGARGNETCVAACAAPTPDVCGSSCTDLQSDPRHCGACGTACDSYQACERGRCSPRYVNTAVLAAPEGAIPAAIAIAPNGAYFVAGSFTQPVDLDPGAAQDIRTPGSAVDGFVVKFNADGSYAWARTWPIESYIAGLTVAADGAVIVTGSFYGTVDFDPGTGVANLTGQGYAAPFVLKLNATGGLAWARTFPVTAAEVLVAAGSARSAAIAPDGSVYVVGSFRGQVDLDPGATTDLHRTATDEAFDVYVVKLTAAGTFVWGRAFGGAQEDDPGALAVDASGLLWIGGTFTATVDFDPGAGVDSRTAVGASDGFLVRWDGAGNYRDGRVFGLGDADYVGSISFDSDGSAYVGGNTTSGNATIGFVQKLTAAGDPSWLHRPPAVYMVVAAPGGGVLFSAGEQISEPGASMWLVNKLDREGRPVWSIPAPPYAAFYGFTFVVDATKLVIGGMTEAGAFDLDPGAGTAFATTVGTAITRYDF